MELDIVSAETLWSRPTMGTSRTCSSERSRSTPTRSRSNTPPARRSPTASSVTGSRASPTDSENSASRPATELASTCPTESPSVRSSCCHAGVVASPLNPEYRRREIEYQLEHADADAVLIEGDADEYVREAVADLETEIVSATAADGHPSLPDLGDDADAAGDAAVVDREDDDVLLQPYTSGNDGPT